MIARARSSTLLLALAFVFPRLVVAAEAAEVTCKDGTKSHAGKGACSGHGGVDKSASKPASEPASAETQSTATKSTSKSKSKAETEPAAPKEKSSKSSTAGPSAGATEAAEVTCKDGTKSHAGKGACSGHGGVDKGQGAGSTATSAPAPATAPPASTAAPVTTAAPAPVTSTSHPKSSAGDKGPPTAKCKDGTLSYAQHHTGACSNHGGVAEWLDATPK